MKETKDQRTSGAEDGRWEIGDWSAGEKEKDMKETKDQRTKRPRDQGTTDYQRPGLQDHRTTDHGTMGPEEESPKHQNPNSIQIPRSKFQLQGPGTSGVRDRGAGRLQLLCSMIGVVVLCGCGGTRALKGGKAFTARNAAGGVSQVLLQGENPSQATKQDQETIKVRTYTLPAGTRMEECSFDSPNQKLQAFVLSAAMPVTEREESRARTELGAAQKDTARELGAKLSSLKGLVWVGLLMFVFGIASFAWPPLKAIIGSVTTSAAITLGGVALMILPALVVGHELLILGGVAAVVGAWFLAHRHGRLHGQVAATPQYRGWPWNS
jgi:hypothetical protein